MTMREQKQTKFSALKADLVRFAKSKRGVAAIEFAFIAPILLSLYFVTMEVAQAIEANKKVGRAASMIADLITQQQTVNKADVDAIMKIGKSVLQPYSRSEPEFIVTGIQITDEDTPKALVSWSRKISNGVTSRGETPGDETEIPTKLMIRNSFLVRVETELNYKPIITYSPQQKKTLGLTAAFDNINMSERYHLRPRQSSTIPCGDC